jgi:signal transduction histidine kinase
VGHQIVAATRLVENAIKLHSADPEAALRSLAGVNSQLSEIADQVRNLAHELFPPELEVLGLTGALAERAMTHTGVNVILDVPVPLPPLPAAIEVAAYYIALEAVTNVDKHAAATLCRIALHLRHGVTGQFLELEVSDDGSGRLPGGAGLGLLSMRARASELGGECVIRDGPFGGTAVVASLPVPDLS